MSGARYLAGSLPLRLAAGLVFIFTLLAAAIGSPAIAGPFDTVTSGAVAGAGGDGQMLLEADQLVYDYDHDTVSAVGNVRVYYKNYAMQAVRLTYNRRTSRLLAAGNVRITEPDGSIVTSENIDVTDDFRDGFVSSLRVQTVDRTRFAAQSAQRISGDTTIFEHGVYTACEPCKQHPERTPLWQVKAGKIVQDNVQHTVTFHNAALEFFGVPVVWMPVFWTPDATVKRKSGFLIPRAVYSKPLGYGVRAPYFWALAPNYDLTFAPEALTRQGFLGDVLWRHRLINGAYSVEVAGIHQNDPSAFVTAGSRLPVDQRFRGGIATKGDFALSPDWAAGWDATLTSDRTFTRYYGVLNRDASTTQSNVHLTGLNGRDYFDARAYYFHVLTDSTDPAYDQGRQPIVHPVIDHNYIVGDPVLGGELSFKSNLTSLTRQESDGLDVNGDGVPDFYRGVAGSFTRLSSLASWQRQFIGPAGQVFTPFASLRADAFFLSPNDPAALNVGLTGQSSVTRFMPAIGFEWRWPWLIAQSSATHVIEPIVQLIARPNESNAGRLPNEDAQSLVFDDTNLFQRDKFSGFDRVEGGTRLNAGLHYNGNFGGMTIDGLVGESFQLAGTNPFATPDIADTGAFSGLQTDRSDIVSRLKVEGPTGRSITARARFNESDFSLNRGELEAAAPFGPVAASGSLIYLRNLSTTPSTKQWALRSSASARLFDNWRVYGSVTYDLTTKALAGDSVGLAFDNDCLSLSIAYSEVRPDFTDLTSSREVWLRLELRTLGSGAVASSMAAQ